MSDDLIPYNSGDLAQVGPRISDDWKDLALAAQASNTRRAYLAQWKQWVTYAEEVGCSVRPAHPVDVGNWLATRAKTKVSVSTLRTAVAAIRSVHQAVGLHFDTQHPAVVLALAGASRSNAREISQATPLTGPEVLEILEGLGNRPQDLRDGALLGLAYIFGLRRSEVVGIDLDELGDGDSVLRITAKEIKLNEVRGKTIKGQPRERVAPRQKNALAVGLIERWVRAADVKAGEPLLRRFHKGDKLGARLDDQGVNRIIQARVADHYVRHRHMEPEAAAKAAKTYSGHSLRVGFAVTAAEQGADVTAVAKAGGWRGPAMPMRYGMKADQLRTSPHNLPGVGLSRPERREE